MLAAVLKNLFTVLEQRGGRVTKEYLRGTTQFIIEALLPVHESFGFAKGLPLSLWFSLVLLLLCLLLLCLLLLFLLLLSSVNDFNCPCTFREKSDFLVSALAIVKREQEEKFHICVKRNKPLSGPTTTRVFSVASQVVKYRHRGFRA